MAEGSEIAPGSLVLPETQLDLFAPAIFEVLDDARPKGDLATLEFPMFSLQTRGALDTSKRTYVFPAADKPDGRAIKIEVKPSNDGCPTIFDKAILVYAASKICAALNNHLPVSRRIALVPRDLLLTIGRGDAGKDYGRLVKSLDRLTGVRIKTTIETGGIVTEGAFGLVDSYVFSGRPGSRNPRLEITLSEWLYRALANLEVLTLHPGYYTLPTGLERRLYEIARKHCGRQPRWEIGLEKLHAKSGSPSSLPSFRFQIRQLLKCGGLLLEYILAFDASRDVLIAFTTKRSGQFAYLRWLKDLPKPEPAKPLSPPAIT